MNSSKKTLIGKNTNLKNFAWNRICAVVCMLLVAVIGMSPDLMASHIVGGELSYRTLGDNQIEITLRIRRDCENANEEADYDDPAEIGIFDADGNWLFGSPGFGLARYSLDFPGATMIEGDINAECIAGELDLCVEETIYRDTFFVSSNFEDQITFAYFRCCRNVLLDNIFDPLTAGSIYKINLTEKALTEGNHSAQFTNHTPLYICANETWNFDHSATDADGDELRYSLYTPFEELDSADAQIDGSFSNLDLNSRVTYLDPTYSEDNMLGGPDALTIDATTGLLTAVPTITGVFLIGVKVDEIRDGEVINTVYRDMEIAVVPCVDLPTASFEVDSLNCDGLDVTFTNTSQDAIEYEWFFDFPDTTFTSTLEQPGTITYPEAGKYRVVLRAYSGDGCFAEAIQNIIVSDFDAEVDFTVEADDCIDEIVVTLADNSTEGQEPIVGREWLVETPDSNYTGTGDTLMFVLDQTTDATITYTIFDEIGCLQSITKNRTFNILSIDFDTDNDTITNCLGDSIQLLATVNPDYTYQWSPQSGLSDPNSGNTLAFPVEDIWYSVTVSDGLCELTDSVYVRVVDEQGSIEVSIDTLTCEGFARLLASNSADADMEWSDEPTFENIIGTGSSLELNIDDEINVYVRVVEGVFECIELVDSIAPLRNPGIEGDINVDFEKSGEISGGTGDTQDDPIMLCPGEMLTLIVEGDLTDGNVTYDWMPEECILSGNGTDSVEINTSDPDCDVLTLVMNNDFGCTDTVQFFIAYDSIPELSIQPTDTFLCWNEALNLAANNPDGADLAWDLGDGTVLQGDNVTHTYQEAGDYTVVVMSMGMEMCSAVDSIHVTQISEIEVDITINSESGDSVFCLNESGVITIEDVDLDQNFTYQWMPEECIAGDNMGTSVMVTADSNCTMLTVLVTDTASGCTLEVPVDLNVSIPDCSLDAEQDTIVIGEETTIFTECNFEGDPEYIWTDPDGNVVGNSPDLNVSPDETTTYCLTVIDENGCESQSCIEIVVLVPTCDEKNVLVPNFFTPNGDNVNDLVDVVVLEEFIEELEFIIYNRYGEQVYQSTQISDPGWGGIFEDEQFGTVVYAYYLRVVCINGDEYVTQGNITALY